MYGLSFVATVVSVLSARFTHSSHVYWAQLVALSSVAAKEIVVTVGLNTTGNASAVFQPQRIVAALGDFVTFNCTFLIAMSFGTLLTMGLQSLRETIQVR